MVKQKFVWLESGYLDGAPLQICDPVYDGTGLISDLPIRCPEQVRTVIRYTLGERKEIERSKLASIQVDAKRRSRKALR
jgi:hypothetical protein